MTVTLQFIFSAFLYTIGGHSCTGSDLSSYKRVRVVLGNETCDLDSAVCSLVQAFSEHLDAKKANETSILVIPVMNIVEREYRVKTEVVFVLNLHNVTPNMLTFRDQIDLQGLKSDTARKLETVLVDHHTLSKEDDVLLTDSVTKIIDHRPRDTNWPWPGRSVRIENVGSCATLVAQDFLERHPEAVNGQLSSLLRGPILIDTHNFSKEADRATPADVRIVEILENVGKLDTDREKAFNAIVQAKADVSRLTADDLLIRDMKVVNGIPIVGLPMLVKNFLELQDALKSIVSFAESRQTELVVLMGLNLDPRNVARDVAIFSSGADEAAKKITQALTASTQPFLDLNPLADLSRTTDSYRLFVYGQGNLRATRKHVLPIVRECTA